MHAFDRVIGVVQAYRDEFADAVDTRANPCPGGCDRKARGIENREGGETAGPIIEPSISAITEDKSLILPPVSIRPGFS
ncbi:hypothetical protein [Bradyrhizobium sp. 174]|uniref:hypothetical protein n=1 Tax=Bradyrhizobium sp. 174 TaxID=2782645 RepID=UPI001FF935E9|nr:hypothetical protein [Bradyrhizobium sp. 174]MCK1571889.1 hypothetical protein [Bradyrhizobium sp. 174]